MLDHSYHHVFLVESRPPFSSGVLDCTSSSSSNVLVCFLEGLIHMRKKNHIYFNLYLIFIFYNKLPETGVVVFCLHEIPKFGRANVKDVHLNVRGGKNVSCLTLPFFMCKEKKHM